MTEVRGLIEAQAIDAVCVAGDRVAIYCATSTGIVLVQAPLKDFIAKARGQADHHGRPFPALARCERLEAELEADAEASLPKGAPEEEACRVVASSLRDLPPLETKRGRPLTAMEIATLRAAWRLYIADPAISRLSIADHLRTKDATVVKYFKLFAAEPGAPVLRPNGRL